MCIQELFAGVGVLHLEHQAQPDPSDHDKLVSEAQEEEEGSLAQMSAEISRLREEAILGREKIQDLQEQV